MIGLKNSFFVTVLCSLGRFIANLYKGSFASKVVDKIFNLFSALWKESSVVSFLSKENEEASSASLLCRFIFRLKNIYLAFGRWLKKVLSGSFVYTAIRSFAGGVLAVNTRFFGVMFCAMAISYCGILVLAGGSVSVYGIAVLILGVVLSLFNKDLIHCIKKSEIISKAVGLFGNFDIPFIGVDIYSLIAAAVVGLISGVLLYNSLFLAALAVCGFIGMALVLMYPVVGVFAAVFAAPFLPTMVLVALVLFVFASYFVHALCSGNFPAKVKNVTVALVIFVLINIVSAFTSFVPVNSVQVLCVSTSLMLIYFVICGTIRTKSALSALIKVFAVSAFFVALYGICQYLFGWGLDIKNAWIDEEMFEDATVRVYSTLGNPNVLGEYLLLAAFPCLAFLFHSEKWSDKLISAVIFCTVTLCLIFTQSRGCWIGFLLGITVYVTFVQGKLWGLLPLAIAVMPLIIPESVIARFTSIGDLNDTSSSYRMYIWLGTIEMLKDFWLFGVGQGQKAYNAIYPFYSYSAITAPHAHNLYLQIFAECGIGAVAAFVVACWMWFKKVVSAFRKSTGRDPLMKGIAITLGCGVLAYLVQGLFDYVFYNYRVVMVFWAVIGMGIAAYNVSEAADD